MAVAKDELRQAVRRLRDALAPDRAKRAATAAARHLVALRDARGPAAELTIERVSAVALYAAIGSEIDTSPLARRMLKRSIALAYPRVQTDTLRLAFHRVADPDDLEPGSFGIPEPHPDSPIMPLATIELMVIPGTAFDPRGYRVGWGKGYYDVTLAQAPRALKVGLAFECQMVPEVPADSHDVPMDIIVTEDGVRRCSVDR
jgi:5-formyltetrahydrofolate cyclo-ligase